MEIFRLFPILIIMLAILIFLAIKRHKITKQIANKEEDYIKREHDANFARKQDISGLDYIVIPDNIIALDPRLAELAATDKSILNLTGQTNTDLKLAYGVANLETLSRCDENFSMLVKILAELQERYFEIGDTSNAIIVGEYAVSIGSDVAKTYELLYKIYSTDNQADKIEALKGKASTLNSIRKDAILNRLQ